MYVHRKIKNSEKSVFLQHPKIYSNNNGKGGSMLVLILIIITNGMIKVDIFHLIAYT